MTGNATTGFKVACQATSAPSERGRSVGEANRVGVVRQDDGDPSRPGFAKASPGNPPLSGEGKGAATLSAGIVILAGNGYLAGVDKEVEARVMPIDNYIVATEPMGAGAPGGLIAGGEAVSDTRFVVYYFRPSADGRLVFGGGETYGNHSRSDVAPLVRDHLARVYPALAEVPIAHAWGGTLAITLERLPYIRRVRPGVYAAAGYSGQGVAIAPFAGKAIAEAIAGNPGRLDSFAALPVTAFPGGPLLRFPALVAAMTWYKLRDWL